MSELLPAEVLGQLEDLSAQTLYSAEIKRIPIMPRDTQAAYTEAARQGDTEAAHQLLKNCLNWMMTYAARLHRAYAPKHTDIMDLVAEGNVKMLEALPNAIMKRDPTSYLMTIGANEIRRYCTYRDPLVRRSRKVPEWDTHPVTVPLDEAQDVTAPLPPENEQAKQLAAKALGMLTTRQRDTLGRYYGVGEYPLMTQPEIAKELGMSRQGVGNSIDCAREYLSMNLSLDNGV